MSEQLELPLEQKDTFQGDVDVANPPINKDPETKQLSGRDLKMAMAKAYKERNDQIKQNKLMLEEMQLEVAYWKAQADLLRYRFEKMDFYLKNLETEPKYLAAVEEQKIKEERANGIPTAPSQILS